MGRNVSWRRVRLCTVAFNEQSRAIKSNPPDNLTTTSTCNYSGMRPGMKSGLGGRLKLDSTTTGGALCTAVCGNAVPPAGGFAKAVLNPLPRVAPLATAGKGSVLALTFPCGILPSLFHAGQLSSAVTEVCLSNLILNKGEMGFRRASFFLPTEPWIVNKQVLKFEQNLDFERYFSKPEVLQTQGIHPRKGGLT